MTEETMAEDGGRTEPGAGGVSRTARGTDGHRQARPGSRGGGRTGPAAGDDGRTAHRADGDGDAGRRTANGTDGDGGAGRRTANGTDGDGDAGRRTANGTDGDGGAGRRTAHGAQAGPGAGGGAIPVFLYHAVMADPPAWIAEFTVSPGQFAAHLDAIAACGRTPVTVSALADHFAGRAPLPPRPVVLTFDDGFADLPGPTARALAGRGLPATAYLTTGAVTPGGHSLLPPGPMMTLAQAAELEDQGIEVGSHTVTHAQLDTLRTKDLAEELRASKAVLEDALGHPVRHLAYPHGYNSPRVRAWSARAGYETATAVRHALSSPRDEPYRIARLIVRRHHTVADVQTWLAGGGVRTAPYRDAPRTIAWRWYRRGRALVRGPEFAG